MNREFSTIISSPSSLLNIQIFDNSYKISIWALSARNIRMSTRLSASSTCQDVEDFYVSLTEANKELFFACFKKVYSSRERPLRRSYKANMTSRSSGGNLDQP